MGVTAAGSAAIGTALVAGGATFATASAIVTALPYIAIAAASVTASAVIAQRQQAQLKNLRASVNDDRGLQADIPQAAPEHMLLLGNAMVAGRRFFWEGSEATRPYFYIGRLLAAHRIGGIDAIYINNQRIQIDPATGFATSTPFYDGVTPFVQVSVRNGLLDQEIDPILAADFPELPATFRQRGIATIVYKLHYGTGADRDAQDEKHQELFGDSQINPLVRVNGALVYDPRNPNHDPDDNPRWPESWDWTKNAALNIAHALCHRWPEMRSRLDWEHLKDAADVCDAFERTKAGEMIRRYTADGAINDGDDARAMVSSLLTSCGGQLIRRRGLVSIRPAQKRLPVGTITEAMLRGAVRHFRDARQGETVNELRPEFMSPERNYQIVPGPVIRDAARVEADGIERPGTARLPFTEGHERAQRLATRLYKEAALGETAELTVSRRGQAFNAGELVRLELARVHPRLTGEWEILSRSILQQSGDHRLQLRAWDAAADAYDPASEEQDFSDGEAA